MKKRKSTSTRSESSEMSERSSTLDTEREVVKDADEALERMGGFGKYQIKVQIILTFVFAMGSYLVYNMGFYELVPEFECSHVDEQQGNWTSWQSCSHTDFCQNLRADDQEFMDDRFKQYEKHKHRIDTSSKKSLINWI